MSRVKVDNLTSLLLIWAHLISIYFMEILDYAWCSVEKHRLDWTSSCWIPEESTAFSAHGHIS